MKSLFFALLALASPAQAALDKSQMITDLDFIRGAFSASYAPAAWKAKHVGWDLDREINAAKEKVNATENISLRDYQRILKGFFQSTKDYHVGVYFHGTESSSLPFTVRGAEGRYFVVYINRDKLSKDAFPFEAGDELLSMNGEPVAAIVERFRTILDTGVPSTDQALAELMLTSRTASNNDLPVERGTVMLEIKRKLDSKVFRRQLMWAYTPESVPEWTGDTKLIPVLGQSVKDRLQSAVAGHDMASPLAQNWQAEEGESALNPYRLGNRVSYLPALGEKIWESAPEKLFHAYIYRNAEGKLIGYIRLPNYGCNITDVNRGERKPVQECVKEFAETMAKFEKTTDGLVIDQVNNPGGNVFYLYALASTLTDQPLYSPLHRMAISQKDALDAAMSLPELEKITNDEEAKKVMGPDLSGYPVTFQVAQFVIEYYRFVRDEFAAGRKLTGPFHIFGAHEIHPHPTGRYTKPVLVLVNSLDFSGGDFFPAILQDNKRVTVMGTRTAGAGGYVRQQQYPNLFGVAGFAYTASLAERVDKNPIENLGVTPDVPYEVTARDLQNNYVDYLAAINGQIAKMVK